MKEAPQAILITVEDVMRVALKHGKSLLRCMLIAACLGVVFSLIRPVRFKAKGSFQEGDVLSSALSFSQLLSNNFGNKKENSAQFLMQSDVILRHVVEQLGLQVAVDRVFSSGFIRNFIDNLQCSITGTLSNTDDFSFANVQFFGKRPKKLLIHLDEEGRWIFLDAKKQILASGMQGENIQMPELCLTIRSVPESVHAGHTFELWISPLYSSVTELKRSIEIRPDRKDQRVLWLSCKHRNPHRAAEIVNQISASFIHYLKQEEEKLAREQLAFLDEHKKKLESEFDQALSQHVSFLKRNIANSGFIEVEQQIELVKRPQQDLRSRMLELTTFEGNLRDVQTTYAQAMGWQKQAADSCTAQAGEGLQANWLIENARFWPEQFAGIDLHTARELHGTYQRGLDQIEEQIDRIEFLLPKVREEEFELNAISALSQGDAVISSMMQKASELALSLREEENYSQKDLHRLKEALKSQKKFIEAHLSHTRDLYQKQGAILHSKLASLRTVMLKLIEAEKGVVQDQLSNLQEQLADVPERWQSEKQLEAKNELMQKIIEGMTQVIEGKIIDHHLKNISSKMIDFARSPERPHRTGLINTMALFSLTGAVLAYFFFFTRTLWRGFPLSSSTAQAYGLCIAGKLSIFRGAKFAELPKTDLETMRNMVDFIESHAHPLGTTTVAIVGLQQRGLCENLARLFSWEAMVKDSIGEDRWSKKAILVVDLSFSPSISSAREGLWQFLQGKTEEWEVVRKMGFDLLPSGGATRFATEIFRGDRFHRFLEEARQKYDRILLVSETPLDASETLLLLKLSDLGMVFVQEESYETLQRIGIAEMAKGQHKAAIILESV